MLTNDLENLYTKDIYSLILFAVYKLHDTKNYAVISDLIYTIDKDNLLKLCAYFGGMTITIPTTEELSNVINALLLFSYVNIEKKDFTESLNMITTDEKEKRKIKKVYKTVESVVRDYDFTHNEK